MELTSQLSAVVTGGASGLGAATARMLAEEGVKVAIFDLNAGAGERVASEVGGVFCGCDVTSDDSVAEALGTARAAHGQERILVNCAGIATAMRTIKRDRNTGEVVPHDIGLFTRAVEINLIGTFRLISRCAAGMCQAEPITPDGGRGVIVNTASVAAEDGQIGQVAYAASKGGVSALTLPVARDLSRDGIRVVTILPGLFETPMFDGLGDDVRESLAKSVPFPSRLGYPAEYAKLVRHICENDMLNGCNIRLDGAIRLAIK